MKFLRNLLAATLVSAGALSAPAATASYMLTFQDTAFTINQVDSDTFTLRIQNALNASGDWTNANSLDNLGFKDIGTGFTSATITPGSWTYSRNELNANGCAGGVSGGICFDAAPAIALTNDMTFTIDVFGNTLDFASFGPHLKIRFLEIDKNRNIVKSGSLLSENLPGQVPEPTSIALLGLGLVGLSFLRRRVRD